MFLLEYTPRALDDLQRIREYLAEKFGEPVAVEKMKQLTKTSRQLEQFPKQGPELSELLPVRTDYRYLVIRPNYVFYRLEMNKIKIIRVLNEKQDFLQILFGLSNISEESEEYIHE